jgi:hypothetical protein
VENKGARRQGFPGAIVSIDVFGLGGEDNLASRLELPEIHEGIVLLGLADRQACPVAETGGETDEGILEVAFLEYFEEVASPNPEVRVARVEKTAYSDVARDGSRIVFIEGAVIYGNDGTGEFHRYAKWSGKKRSLEVNRALVGTRNDLGGVPIIIECHLLPERMTIDEIVEEESIVHEDNVTIPQVRLDFLPSHDDLAAAGVIASQYCLYRKAQKSLIDAEGGAAIVIEMDYFHTLPRNSLAPR